jgi:hypothetical protein
MHVTLLLKNFLEEENPGYTRVIDQAFTALPDNLGFNNGLATPQPDMAEGLMAREFMPFPIDDQLGGVAVFIKDEKDSITLPHLAAEFVGPGKDMLQARIQSAYDGAALVYARNEALKYIGKPDPRGYSAITTFTSDGTSVCFFAHYADQSETDGKIEYHQYSLGTISLTDSYDTWVEARRQLRNVQEDARNRSYDLRDQLVDYWNAESVSARETSVSDLD